MAHSLSWPGKYFFYPIGNTSAISLTRDLAPSVPVNLLLLGCGDPRNVLYTMFCEPTNAARKLDFTCSDWDGGILARNVILFSMILDKVPQQTIWNIFFHMKLDEDSHTTLVQQSQKLAEFAKTESSWRASTYGAILKIGAVQTLDELRRHWLLYAEMHQLPAARHKAILSAFNKHRTSVLNGLASMGAARSAGPLMSEAFGLSDDTFRGYWKNSVASTNQQVISAATLLNPTFVCSRGEDACCIHYGLTPVIPFHLDSIFAKAKGEPTPFDVYKHITNQFSTWCDAFRRLSESDTTAPVVRFLWGDALHVAQCLRAYDLTQTLDIGVPVSQWKTQIIQLSCEEYKNSHAPTRFDVVDTSNLTDHLGLLNILVAVAPLLSTPSGVLYTESLLFHGQDATKEFNNLLHADFAVFALLSGICPVDYLSGFTTRSNVHELMAYMAFKNKSPQFHQVTTWRAPFSCDAGALYQSAPSFDSRQLATFLYDMYHLLFEQEDSMHFWRIHGDKKQEDLSKAIASTTVTHYTRETFALLLKLLKERLAQSSSEWTSVMDWFFVIHGADRTLPMDGNNRNDLWGHLYRHGLYTTAFIKPPFPRIGPFALWSTVPMLVRVVLVIPREHLQIFEDQGENAGTPPLVCYVNGNMSNNVFSSVHVAYGRAIRMGTPERPWVRFEEDPLGRQGSSPCVASFLMPSHLLVRIEPPEGLRVHLALRSVPSTVMYYVPKLGPMLSVFSAPLMDRELVHILPEQPLPFHTPQAVTLRPSGGSLRAEIGDSGAISVELDEQCEQVSVLVSRISIRDSQVKEMFQGGVSPEIAQSSSCVMRVSLGGRTQDVAFPFPIAGSKNRLRLARKSLYIEVVVPLSGGLKADGMRLNRYPVLLSPPGESQLRAALPWGIHRLNLSTLPPLNLKAKSLKKWLDPHLGASLSASERALIKKPERASSSDTDAVQAFLKQILHAIFVRATGIQHGPPLRVINLGDDATHNCDTIILVNEVRHDVACHTVVCDAFVLPLTPMLIQRNQRAFPQLVGKGKSIGAPPGVMAAWKRLLPALVERCRTWEHGPNCEYAASGRIPLTEEMEEVPICSCGAGKDVEEMKKDPIWRVFAPHATRVAISPLFAVSYLERIGRDPEAHRCALCRGRGKPKLKACTGCKKIRYCSEAC
ncbi:hypothetical protein PENSPDRAFT_664442 [Peniophora sp. CONT]|nr:hypothetical protein PENSPDRAFT_664442 [Peniophora sp. CONT]